MKIAFLLDDSLDRTDGVQQYVITLGNYYKSQGHEVHYLVGSTLRKDISNIHSLSRNIKVKFNKNNLSVPLHSNKRKIKDILNKHKFDVVHVQAPYSPLMSSRVISNLPKETVVVGTFHILPFSKKEKYATKLLSMLVNKTNSRIDGFISVSKPAKEFARNYFGVDSIVIPNPVNRIKRSSIARKGDRINLTFLGRLVDRKGPMELLNAFSEISKSNSRVFLNIYGDGPLRSKAENYGKNLNIQNVAFHGYIDEDKKYRILADSDIAVFPSKGGESFGIVLTEAISAGAGVVIGGDNPGYRSVLKYDETLFDPTDINNFIKVLNKFINRKDLRAKYNKIQNEQINEYYVDIVAKKIESYYLKLIKEKSIRI